MWAEVGVAIGLTICAQLSLRSALPGLSPLLKSKIFSGGISVSAQIHLHELGLHYD